MYIRTAVALFGMALMVGCASEGSLTAGTDTFNGSRSVQITNGQTGETVVLPNVLDENASVDDVNTVADEVVKEMAWDVSNPGATNSVLRPIMNKTADGCGDVRDCGPYVNEGCNGSDKSCNCIKVCPTSVY